MKRIPESDKTELRYANWLKMCIDLIGPKNLYLIGGRGLGKTTDILADRAIEIIYEMPGGSFAFVGDTYINLQKNVIKTFLEGWEKKGWFESVDGKAGHFVCDEKPPSFFQRSFSRIESYRHTISVFNGCNFTLVSMDRPSTGAGNNFLHLFGDEVKYIKEEKLKKLTPAIRGDSIRFGHSTYYRGRTFTTDYPDTNSIREDAWILRMEKNMDKSQIRKILECAFVLNDIRIDYLKAEEQQDPDLLKKVSFMLKRWEERYYRIRNNSTLFYIASSYVNADILREGYFMEQFADLVETDFNTSILSMKPSLEKGAMFYGNLADKHFFSDGYNYDHYDKYNIRDTIQEDCRGLKYLRFHDKLEAGADFGNMISLVVGQDQWPVYRCLKNFHVLAPEWITHVARKFTEYFQFHKHKEVDLYYDRSANTFSRQKEDFASKLKGAIEKEEISPGIFRDTGWVVNLMSKGQGNITHGEEYDLMNDLMSETNKQLPKLLIDQFSCRELKSSLEIAPLAKDSKGNIQKVKKSEKLAIHLLPLMSTNMSDAFKYLLCRPRYLTMVKSKRAVTMSDPSIRSGK